MGSIGSHSGVYNTRGKASDKFRFLKDFFTYREIYFKLPEVLKSFPSFKTDKDEFVDYELLQDDVEQLPKADCDTRNNCIIPVFTKTGLINVRNSDKDLSGSPLEVKRKQFYAHYCANYSSPKGQWLDSKL